MWNISAYHRGIMAGETPNIDRIAKEGMLFMDHYAHASCTAGRAAFITGKRDVIPNSMQLVAGRTAQEYNQRKNRKGLWEGERP